MSAPVEFRLYASKFTLEDLQAGRQLFRVGQNLYNVAMLQFRYKQRLVIAGQSETQWSEWEYVPFVNEGAEDKPMFPPNPPAAA